MSDTPVSPGPGEHPAGTDEQVDHVAESPSPAPATYDDEAEAPARRTSRLPLVLATAATVLVLGAALAAPLVDKALRGTEQARRALDLTLVQTWTITDRGHTADDVDYPQDPPAGGSHAPIWLACGAYDVPVRDENAVHDLEHGTVWITYDPDLSAEDVAALEAQLPGNGIMSPREGLPSPVVVTVWGTQLQLDGADDERLGLFLDEYGDGHTAPEFGATCEGGTSDPQGGLPEEGTNA